jgi:glucose-6-phosphate isomerase
VPLLEYDISHALGAELGVTWADVQALAPRLEEVVESLALDAGAGMVPFLGLPDQAPDRVRHLAAQARERFDRLVVLGIGGSSLGARVLVEGLTRPRREREADGTKRPQVWFYDSVDPLELRDLLDAVDWERTQWNVVTKSGTTIETLSAYFVVRAALEERFGEQGARERLVITTDPERGPLREIVRREGVASLDSPQGVCNRYGVFSPVGLYPAAFAGADLDALVQGAIRARDRCLTRDVLDNPAAIFAAVQYLNYQAGRNIVVFMPYATALERVAEWFAQLWGESLGKRRGDQFVGATPVRALGVRDQHSQLQLYMEGPKDKNIVFVEVSDFRESVLVPISKGVPGDLSHLCGKDVADILAAELRGTRQALAEERRVTSTLRLRSLSADALGALLMALELATAIAGGLFEVDPFDQPGVELGKRYAHGLLGRPRESHYAASLVAAEAARERRTLTV